MESGFPAITEPLLDRDHFLHDYEPGSTETALPRASLTNREAIQQQHLLLSHEHGKRTSMKNILVTSLTTGALASAAPGLAGNANAAPSGPLSVDTTVSQLRAQGFEVIVNRIGTAPQTSARSALCAPARRSRAPTPVCLERATTSSQRSPTRPSTSM
jgi:hypothetical protein